MFSINTLVCGTNNKTEIVDGKPMPIIYSISLSQDVVECLLRQNKIPVHSAKYQQQKSLLIPH